MVDSSPALVQEARKLGLESGASVQFLVENRRKTTFESLALTRQLLPLLTAEAITIRTRFMPIVDSVMRGKSFRMRRSTFLKLNRFLSKESIGALCFDWPKAEVGMYILLLELQGATRCAIGRYIEYQPVLGTGRFD